MNHRHEKGHVDGNTVVSATPQDGEIAFEPCILEDRPDPCIIVIVGASGDLTSRKLVPALYNLYLNSGLPDPFVIVGCARTALDDEGFRKHMNKALSETNIRDKSKWPAFASHLHYQTVDYADYQSFVRLAEAINGIDHQYKTRGNKLFYLAIPPSLYQTSTQMLGKARLTSEGVNGNGWCRIIVEKPFGHNLDSAIGLDRILHEYFGEHQIFRIDHYLAKETVQNILMFRFANAIFEPIWNRRYIDYISITSAESLGVEHRAGYYEQAGVLRDMFQNHMLQLLALTTMEPPSLFQADRVRDEKVKVYRALRPFPVENLWDHLVLGQYDSGVVDGRKVAAYRDEHGVNPQSLTPTFALMRVFLDNWRWQGVPIFLTSGKRLAKKLTEITIQFKEVPHSMFRKTLGEHILANRLTLGIYPDEKISLIFQTKNPGAKLCLRSVTMDFHYHQDYSGPILDAYEKAILDCMLGDHMLFWRQDGVELCWSFLTPVLEQCETCQDRQKMLFLYGAGTWGPSKAEDLKKKMR